MATIEGLNQAIRVLKDHCFDHGTDCDGCELRDFCDAINAGIMPYGWDDIDEKADKKKNNVTK